jgi:hypothetical protein
MKSWKKVLFVLEDLFYSELALVLVLSHTCSYAKVRRKYYRLDCEIRTSESSGDSDVFALRFTWPQRWDKVLEKKGVCWCSRFLLGIDRIKPVKRGTFLFISSQELASQIFRLTCRIFMRVNEIKLEPFFGAGPTLCNQSCLDQNHFMISFHTV